MSGLESSDVAGVIPGATEGKHVHVNPLHRGYTRFAYILMAPALFFYTLFLILPMLGTVVISFTDWTGINFATMRFNGLENFRAMANDPFFWKALKDSFLFVAFSLTLELGLALIVALLLESGIRLSGWFRGIYFVPSVLSLVVIGLLFSFILDPTIGIVDILLRRVGLNSPAFGWLGTPGVNIYVVIAAHIWRQFGFTMFLLIAGLQAVPRELQEAARLDGATPWQLTTRVTIPLIRDVLVVAALLTSVSAMRVFDLVYVMTQGGPYHASETVVTYVYDLGLGTGRTQQGYATAIAFVLMLLIMGMSGLQLWLTRAGKDS